MNAHASPPPVTRSLKAGLHRRVFVEQDAGGTRRVVKRFEGRGLWKRLGDRARARREFVLLTALRQAGAPVPRPGELRKRAGAWEFTCEYIEDSTTLEALLEDADGTRSPAAPEQLARALGRALAAAHSAGLDHTDLHAGNLLFDGDGAAWLVDFGSASRRAELGSELLLRDLVQLAAATRERVTPRLRQRALIAWRQALPPELRAALPELPDLARRVERDAVVRRVRVVLEHRDRWLRESGRCRRLDTRTLAAREVAPADCEALHALLEAEELPAAPRPHPSDPEREVLLLEGDARLRAGWTVLGRAREHNLPALQPLLLRDATRMRVLLGLPRGARKLTAAEALSSRARPALQAALAERGLRELHDESELWSAPSGELLLGPGTRLDAADPRGGLARG